MNIRRIWPSSRHPNPTQVQIGHGITIDQPEIWRVVGVGLDKGQSLLVEHFNGERRTLKWNESERRWT